MELLAGNENGKAGFRRGWQAPLALFALLFFLWGCGFSAAKPEVLQIAPLPDSALCRVAVLPFINGTGYSRGDTVVYRVFLSELNRLGGLRVTPEGDVRKIYRQLQLGIKDMPDNEQARILADRLGVEAIVVGRIDAMGEESKGEERNPFLALELRLIGTPGRTLASVYHRRDGEYYRTVLHFGKVNTITELTAAVCREVLSAWRAQGFFACES